jgi:hypothetical protein
MGPWRLLCPDRLTRLQRSSKVTGTGAALAAPLMSQRTRLRSSGCLDQPMAVTNMSARLGRTPKQPGFAYLPGPPRVLRSDRSARESTAR